MIYGFPIISVVLLGLAILIVLIMLLALMTQSMTPTLPPPIFSDRLMQEYLRDMQHSNDGYIIWGIVALILCVLAVIFAL